ncbi:peptide chain release factor N(5)-glutamine methyltransferase [Candidatus Protochlamydia phocaeensis]|uniref:peptide chain release factor N(5)-glutamine methyltransferase n=1 Tax=Candidatus Protochlamydia phocaeensis TaxID=1414722 RepID=UPI000838C181|nr:peptide chain release factor N(5)-glutamine methyltransferase [Candidatus Protochlamydia phocaeensis]
MKVIAEALQILTHALEKAASIPYARRQAEEILCDVLSCDRLSLYINSRHPLKSEEWANCQAYLARRLKGEPLAYIKGTIEFYNCLIHVNPSVLIPRQETEILVDKIVHILSKEDLRGKTLWDVCCGSGCIGIALKKRFPLLQVVLADQSKEALELASYNANENKEDVVCLQGDLLTPFQGQKTHFFVCNPPYISEQEFEQLDPDVREFEPKLALLGGVSGIEFYERLAKELPVYLHPHSKVWFEIGYNQGEAVQALFKSPPWKNQHLENDWAGHNRFFFLENE